MLVPVGAVATALGVAARVPLLLPFVRPALRRTAVLLGTLPAVLPAAAPATMAAPLALEQAVQREVEAVRGGLPSELPNGMTWYRAEADGVTFVVYQAFPDWVPKSAIDEAMRAELRQGYIDIACAPRFRQKLEEGWRNRWVLTTGEREQVMTIDVGLSDCD